MLHLSPLHFLSPKIQGFWTAHLPSVSGEILCELLQPLHLFPQWLILPLEKT